MPQLKATRFMRQPFFIMGHEVTEDNMEAIAQWCQGQVILDGDRPFVRVPVNRYTNERQTRAYPGMWVTVSKQRDERSFKVYTKESLMASFFKLPDDEEIGEANSCCGKPSSATENLVLPSNVGARFIAPPSNS